MVDLSGCPVRGILWVLRSVVPIVGRRKKKRYHMIQSQKIHKALYREEHFMAEVFTHRAPHTFGFVLEDNLLAYRDLILDYVQSPGAIPKGTIISSRVRPP